MDKLQFLVLIIYNNRAARNEFMSSLRHGRQQVVVTGGRARGVFEYFAVLRVDASSAAGPGLRAAAATYESANGQMTVMSRVNGLLLLFKGTVPLYIVIYRCAVSKTMRRFVCNT